MSTLFPGVPDHLLESLTAEELVVLSMLHGGIEVEKKALLAISIARAEEELKSQKRARQE